MRDRIPCPRCHGSGEQMVPGTDAHGYPLTDTCGRCHGTGDVEARR